MPVEGGGKRPSIGKGDAHVLLVEAGTCKLWEVFAAQRLRKGASWDAGSGAVFDLSSNALRPDGWTSADAAGLPILPGLIRYDEIVAGEITHAIRFTAAAHAARLRLAGAPLRQQLDRSRAAADGHPRAPEGDVRHQRLLADEPDHPRRPQALRHDARRQRLAVLHLGRARPRWDDDDLHELQARCTGSDFEVVDVSSLMVDPDSGQAAP